jgi:hypothetical protein
VKIRKLRTIFHNNIGTLRVRLCSVHLLINIAYFVKLIIIFALLKGGYLNSDVNCPEPSSSVMVSCLRPKDIRTLSFGVIPLQTISGLYYKHKMIVNDDSVVIRMTLQVVASPTIIILTVLEVSVTLLQNIYSTVVTHDNCREGCNIFIVEAPGFFMQCHGPLLLNLTVEFNTAIF